MALAYVEIIGDGTFPLMRDHTLAKPDGWLFHYQSREYVETGKRIYALMGNGPFLITRQNFD